MPSWSEQLFHHQGCNLLGWTTLSLCSLSFSLDFISRLDSWTFRSLSTAKDLPLLVLPGTTSSLSPSLSWKFLSSLGNHLGAAGSSGSSPLDELPELNASNSLLEDWMLPSSLELLLSMHGGPCQFDPKRRSSVSSGVSPTSSSLSSTFTMTISSRGVSMNVSWTSLSMTHPCL